jgi:hypothetical protein
MLLRHRPKFSYTGAITLLVSAGDYRPESFSGWNALASGSLEIRKAPGIRKTYLGQHPVDAWVCRMRFLFLTRQLPWALLNPSCRIAGFWPE